MQAYGHIGHTLPTLGRYRPQPSHVDVGPAIRISRHIHTVVWPEVPLKSRRQTTLINPRCITTPTRLKGGFFCYHAGMNKKWRKVGLLVAIATSLTLVTAYIGGYFAAGTVRRIPAGVFREF